MKILDLYSIPINLTYKSQDKFTTVTGTLVSVLTIISIVFAIFFFGQDFYLLKNPFIIMKEEAGDGYPTINLNINNHYAAIEVTDGEGKRVEQKGTYSIKAFIAKTIMEANVQKEIRTDVDVTTCQKVYNSDRFDQQFSGALCMRGLDYNITGYLDTSVSYYVGFSVQLCQNSTENRNSCKSKAELLEIFNLPGYSFNLIFYENVVDANNYTNPYFLKKSLYWDYLDPLSHRYVEFFYKKVTVGTDNGMIFSNYNFQEVITVERITAKHEHFDDLNFNLLDIYFSVSNRHLNIRRNYKRAQSVFAELGGIIDFLIIMGSLLCSFVAKKQYELDLIHSFFDFNNFKSRNGPISLAGGEFANNPDLNKSLSNIANIKNMLQNTPRTQIPINEIHQNVEIYDSNLPNAPNKIVKNDNVSINNENHPRKIFYINNTPKSNNISQNENPSFNNTNLSGFGMPSDRVKMNVNMAPTTPKNIENSTIIQQNDRIHIDEKYANELKNYIYRKKKNVTPFDNSPVNYSYFQILKSSLCPYKCHDNELNEKNLTCEYALKIVRENLDVYNLIKITRELDFLKHGLLKDRQLSFINYLGRRKFFFNYNMKETDEIAGEIIDILKIQGYYNELKNIDKFGRFDKKVFDFIDPDLVKIFDKY